VTDSDLRTLRDIDRYRRERGVSPSLLDLARMAGLTSKGGIRAHVLRLIREGYLTTGSGSRPGYVVSRGYRLSASGLAALAESGASTTPTTCPECGQPIAVGAP